jgi:hypothetical protein
MGSDFCPAGLAVLLDGLTEGCILLRGAAHGMAGLHAI